MDATYIIIPLLAGWLLDRWLGDPQRLPHPVVAFGRLISWGERHLNHPPRQYRKGALWALFCVLSVYGLAFILLRFCGTVSVYAEMAVAAVAVFFCLAGKTLVKEVEAVFRATDESLEAGRRQVARIVGRDTSCLSAQQVRTAALETLSENLSDGVIAPLFWFGLLGVPGMLAYKMINTLDSMIGYKNERYKSFGCFAARMDDVANFIPARLAAVLMLLVSFRLADWKFVRRFGTQHASPNSGYPESALAAVLDCRFGGPNIYFGQQVEKPFIGTTDRFLTSDDMRRAIKINRRSEFVMVALVVIVVCLIYGI